MNSLENAVTSFYTRLEAMRLRHNLYGRRVGLRDFSYFEWQKLNIDQYISGRPFCRIFALSQAGSWNLFGIIVLDNSGWGTKHASFTTACVSKIAVHVHVAPTTFLPLVKRKISDRDVNCITSISVYVDTKVLAQFVIPTLLLQEVDLQRLVEESYLIENQYGHYFDWVIVNDDFHVASDMLKEIARRLDDEPQWVPSNWLEEQ